jgi:hypothetical protein
MKNISPVSLILNVPIYLDFGAPLRPIVDKSAGLASFASNLAI